MHTLFSRFLVTFSLTLLTTGCMELGPDGEYDRVEAPVSSLSAEVIYATPANIVDVGPEEAIDYVWGFKNNGGSQWTTGMELRAVSTSDLVDGAPFSLPALTAGAQVFVRPTGESPRVAGTYLEEFELVDGNDDVVTLTGPNTSNGRLVIEVRVTSP